jgi:hypothetical protein
MTHARGADWLAIILQGAFGAFLGGLAGGLLVMNRVTRFMARDEESSLIMVAGCMIAGAGLLMRHGDGLLIPNRTVPSMPLRHTVRSMLLSLALIVIGIGTVVVGVGRYFYHSKWDSRDYKKANKPSLLTPDPPPVPAAMTATTSTPCSTLAPGQA